MRLANKIALITGGSTGIGRATAELYATEGAQVIIVDYNQSEGQAAVEKIQASGGQAAFYQVDVRLEQHVANVFQQIAKDYNHLDLMVCSAGILKGAFKHIEELEESDWDATIDTNLKGTKSSHIVFCLALAESLKFDVKCSYMTAFRGVMGGGDFAHNACSQDII